MENIAKDFLSQIGVKVREIDEEDAKLELSDWGVTESVVDFEKKDLNPALWKDKKLKKEVADQIWEAIDSVLEDTEFNRDNLTAVMLEGSNLTYYYNRYTDIDVHLYIEKVIEEDKEKIGDVIKEFNKKDTFIKDTKNNLELYLMPEEQYKRLAGPRYDLINDKWLANPQKIEIPADMYKAAVEIALTFARDLDLAIGEIKRDIVQYVALNEEIEDMLHIDVSKFKEAKSLKLSEIKADLEALATKEQILKDLRKKAYSEEYVPKEETLYYIQAGEADRSYTLYNMIFKILQRFGYIDPLKVIKYDIYKKALENKDFDDKIEYYLKNIVKALGLFNKINLEEELK
jgi:predicted nucleotidyltransferase